MCAAAALVKPLGLAATKQKDRDVCLAYGVHHVPNGLVPHSTSVLWTGRASNAVRHHELTTTTSSFGLSPLGQPLAMTSTASVFAIELAGTSPSASSHPAKYRLPAIAHPPPVQDEALYHDSAQWSSSFTAQDLRQLLQIGKSDGFETKRERSKADSPTCKSISVGLRAGKRAKDSPTDRQAVAQSRSLPALVQEPECMATSNEGPMVSPSNPNRRDVALPPVQDDSRSRIKGAANQSGGKDDAEKVVSAGRAKGMSIVEGNSTARERATAYHQAFALSVSNLKRRPKTKDNEIMDVHQARERMQKRDLLVNDAEYLDSRIAYLRRGKVHTKWHMRVFDKEQLWENKTLYTTYSVGLRKKKRERKGTDNAPLEQAEPKKRDSILLQQPPQQSGRKKTEAPAADQTKQLTSLTKDLKVSTRSLEVAIDPEKEHEQDTEEKQAAAQQASFLAELQASFRRKIGPGNDAAQAESPPSSAKPTQAPPATEGRRKSLARMSSRRLSMAAAFG
mmetsp:Transcript_42557/g.97571  ORF Transcript_42557/g.97571 Transcript_42557/m.97571 type:complete len:507 (+) Transcript_42557:109-1629(+)